jgi:hypothetical protein
MSENLNNLIPYMKQIMAENTDIITKVLELYKTASPEKIRGLIEKHFIPSEKEKKENAEIPTPVKLVDEMLDKIPKSFWTKPQKVLEPCCGKGNFVLGIFDRFYNGMKRKYKGKEAELCKIIITECLYFIDIEDLNVFITKSLLICHCKMYAKDIIIDDTKDFNCIVENTLEVDIKDKMDIDGFNAVIGNPPYQNKNATGDNKLYLEFIKMAINILKKNKYLLFIVPINVKNYITNQEKNRSYINKFLNLKYLSLNTANKYFPNISTYFSYFLLENKLVTSSIVNISYIRKKIEENSQITICEGDNLPLCLSTQDFLLINKVSNLIRKNWNTFDIKKATYIKNDKKVTQRIRDSHFEKGYIKKEKDDTHQFEIIDKINIKNPFPGVYYYNNYRMEDYTKEKVIMCSGGYLMPSYDKLGIYNLSDNMLYLLVNSESEYNGLSLLINSKLVKYLNKISMTDNIHGRDHVIKNIKSINLYEINSESDIYRIYNIDEEEITLIENTI